MNKDDRGTPEPRPGEPLPDRIQRDFDPKRLMASVVAIPLLERIQESGDEAPHDVVIDLNLDYPGGRKEARKRVGRLLKKAIGRPPPEGMGIPDGRENISQQYVFARLTGKMICDLAQLDRTKPPVAGPRAIHRIWPDFEVKGLIVRSYATVKADAARNAFSALGDGIVWAVLDSGIDKSHPQFDNGTLKLDDALQHRDFTNGGGGEGALQDKHGHGTHVAGILAGYIEAKDGLTIVADMHEMGEDGQPRAVQKEDLPSKIGGVAPNCKLLSLKVLDDDGSGRVSNIISALEYIQDLNGNGRRLRVHGVNLSVGYDFDPEWFACGQSPLCVEVNRLVRSGVVVVAAAGNTGYGWYRSAARGVVAAGIDLSINDPGNAELAITVGSTHRDMPHMYGVSYFSSKGPTGDGRLKPDLVAPGERILSCASSQKYPREDGTNAKVAAYREDSGTSMAAPHVSGVIAAFLSVRREFIGRPEAVKEIFLSTATDLRRSPSFQGKGLVDLMRAIQSV